MLRPFQFRTGILAFAIAYLLSSFHGLVAQTDSEKNWRLERKSIQRQFADDIQALALQLRQNGDVASANNALACFQPIDLEREYIFLPSSENAPVPPAGWETDLQAIKIAHAERVFELAKKAASEGGGAAGFQFLHEVLNLHPDHEQARKILGHKRIEDGWKITSELVKSRKSTKKESIMGWPAGSFLRVSTPRFEIHSQADEATTLELAVSLERWHDVWRQVFFDFWSSSKTLQRWIDGTSSARPSRKKYTVIFFDGPESYGNQLEPKINGISQSTGYYSDQLRASFFYASDDPQIKETWRHELTHQLFQQSIRTNIGPFHDGYVWLGEGIATYFESLLDFEDHVTLGGFDARRLQFARIRWNRERFRLGLGEISKISLLEYQATEIERRRRLYSQSSGMCHMLMNAESGKYKTRLIEFLKLMYTGKLREDSFIRIVGLNDKTFPAAYTDYLRTENSTLERFLLAPQFQTELSLANPILSEAGFVEIGKCVNLRWLDLTDNAIDRKKLACLKDCDLVEEIYLSNCRIEKGALAELSKLDGLTDVDLTASNCTDSQFMELANCTGLKSVSITATNISQDAVLQFQARLPRAQVLK